MYTQIYKYIDTCKCIYIYMKDIYIYIYRERERERERERDRPASKPPFRERKRKTVSEITYHINTSIYKMYS